MKNNSKYETLEQLKLRFSKRITTMDEEMQNINRVLKAARAETVHEIDVALITCANASNQFFCKYFTADFVVMEDNTSELIPIFWQFQRWTRLFTQSLSYLWALC